MYEKTFNKKKFTLKILILIFIGVLFSYSLVFSSKKQIFYIDSFDSKNIFLDTLDLSKTRLIIKSKENLDDLKLISKCAGNLKKIKSIEDLYIFEINFLSKACKQKGVYLNKANKSIYVKLNFISIYSIYEIYLNKSDDFIKNHILALNSRIKEVNSKNIEDGWSVERNLKELKYLKNILNLILEKRKSKYLVPIQGSKLPNKANKMPNSKRPYRQSYTNGIHKGWDFDANLGSPIIAIDDGIIIRIVKDFKYENLKEKIKLSNLSKKDKTLNLDTLRGNQIWLQTMKGDIVFYSHLDNIFDNVKVGDFVYKGQKIGKVGISGIPDKSYQDYHLHLEVRKNPYNNKKNKYKFLEIMNWDWYFKDKDFKFILENQKNIFLD